MKKVWCQVIHKLKLRYPLKGLKVLCGLLGLTRFAYYKALKQKHYRQEIAEEIITEVKSIREKLPRVGTQKLHYMMVSFRKEKGIKCGRDKLHEILKKQDLLVRPKTLRVKTTYSEHGFRKFENLTQDFEPSGINQLWVSDITYIRTGNRFSYLSLITDAFSRKIIGWSLQPTLHARGPLMALDMALSQKEENSPTPLIHHSDRGIQYCCHQYIRLLQNNEITVSMTESPDPYENALAERTNLTLKYEFLLERGFPSFHQAYHATEKAIHNPDFYGLNKISGIVFSYFRSSLMQAKTRWIILFRTAFKTSILFLPPRGPPVPLYGDNS